MELVSSEELSQKVTELMKVCADSWIYLMPVSKRQLGPVHCSFCILIFDYINVFALLMWAIGFERSYTPQR